MKCGKSPSYFIHHYCYIYDATDRVWIPFHLWPGQLLALKAFELERLVINLKSRQLGITWLAVAFSIWLMIFFPIATILLFSKRDDEAIYLLGEERLKGMYRRLPLWMRTRGIEVDSSHEFRLSNGSVARAFPTTAGDSYTASLVIVDEADLVPNLNDLMRSTKPTIDAGGKMFLVSRVNKKTPNSEFQNIYKAAKKGLNDWKPIFLSWRTRLSRDEAWYEALRKDVMSRTGSLDELWEQYPETDLQALAPLSLDKRIPTQWVLECFYESDPLSPEEIFYQLKKQLDDKEIEADDLIKFMPPAIPGLRVFNLPRPGYHYYIGGDPAEGNPTSDDSAAVVTCQETHEVVAVLQGKSQTNTFASYLEQLATYYSNAPVLVERNNHGHAVISWLVDHTSVHVLEGWDVDPETKKRKRGWLNNSKGKSLLYIEVVKAFGARLPRIPDYGVYAQLINIEGSTLKAPAREHDDLAVAFALSFEACSRVIGVLFD